VGKMPSNLFKVEMGSVEGENNNKAMASERWLLALFILMELLTIIKGKKNHYTVLFLNIFPWSDQCKYIKIPLFINI
jgi:hypothetical protein